MTMVKIDDNINVYGGKTLEEALSLPLGLEDLQYLAGAAGTILSMLDSDPIYRGRVAKAMTKMNGELREEILSLYEIWLDTPISSSLSRDDLTLLVNLNSIIILYYFS